jgi:predicted DNA-binding transcriptional regulator AlpA
MTLTLPPEIQTALLESIRAEAIRQATDELERVRLVSSRTAATLLGVSLATFLQIMDERRIKPVHLGPRITRWRVTDLKAISAPF